MFVSSSSLDKCCERIAIDIFNINHSEQTSICIDGKQIDTLNTSAICSIPSLFSPIEQLKEENYKLKHKIQQLEQENNALKTINNLLFSHTIGLNPVNNNGQEPSPKRQKLNDGSINNIF